MTYEQIKKLRPGDEVFVARCQYGEPVAVLRRKVRRTAIRFEFDDEPRIEVEGKEVHPAQFVFLTEEDAKAYVRVTLALRIDDLKAELSKWF